MRNIQLPLTNDVIKELKVENEVTLTGVVYTARDAAHKLITTSKSLPIDFRNQTVYYTGSTETPPGFVIGSCGPTTSSRMDPYVELMLKLGLKGMIGKGDRSEYVTKLIKKHKAVYFIASGGCGAILSQFVKERKLVAYKELGCEAIYRLRLKNFPVIVAIDSFGNNIYK